MKPLDKLSQWNSTYEVDKMKIIRHVAYWNEKKSWTLFGYTSWRLTEASSIFQWHSTVYLDFFGQVMLWRFCLSTGQARKSWSRQHWSGIVIWWDLGTLDCFPQFWDSIKPSSLASASLWGLKDWMFPVECLLVKWFFPVQNFSLSFCWMIIVALIYIYFHLINEGDMWVA